MLHRKQGSKSASKTLNSFWNYFKKPRGGASNLVMASNPSPRGANTGLNTPVTSDSTKSKKNPNSFWALEDSVTTRPKSNSKRKKSFPKLPPLNMELIRGSVGSIKMLTKERNDIKPISDEEVLKHMKEQVARTLDLYISKWKLSFFGHHHNKRAIQTKAAILKANTPHLIFELLKNQENIMNNINKDKHISNTVRDLLGNYALLRSLKNKPKSPMKSEYARVIKMALELQKNVATTPFQSPPSFEL